MHPVVILRYLRFPLHKAPLLLIGIFSLVLTFFVQGGMFGLYFVVVVASFLFAYGFALLDAAVHGRTEPPVLSYEMVSPVERRSLTLLALLVACYFLTAELQTLIGDGWVAVLRILLLALVPSMVAAMSVTGRIINAINPVAVFGTILRIPVAYGVLLITIGALWYVPLSLLRFMGSALPNVLHKESLLPWHILSEVGLYGFVLGTVGMVLSMYLWLAMFACIGGTIYERRKELEFDAAASPERVAARANAELERQRDKIMDRVFAEIRGGALGNAGNTVRNLIEQAQAPLDECRWLYARAATTDQRLAGFLAQLTLPRLLTAKATGEALKMLRERLAVDPEFRPLTGEQLLQLAQLARDGGQRRIARQLLADFSRHYPSSASESAAVKLQADLAR